jgi:hypothetical protein
MKDEPMLKLNTFITGGVAVLLTAIGFLVAEQLHDIKQALMPRPEIQVRFTQLEADVLDLRARVVRLEEERRK